MMKISDNKEISAKTRQYISLTINELKLEEEKQGLKYVDLMIINTLKKCHGKGNYSRVIQLLTLDDSVDLSDIEQSFYG